MRQNKALSVSCADSSPREGAKAYLCPAGVEGLSLPQSASLTAPSSEGALRRHHRYAYVLVNQPDTGYGIFIENMLDAAG
ncbi:MAG: hypothetical protein E7428_05545 [Ruminococcaceae bacterium]|nr:hypothetical protein [Oscillospiraceae bacterium]